MNDFRSRFDSGGLRRPRAWSTLACACGVLMPYAIGRAAPTEVPDSAPLDVLTVDREFAQLAIDAGVRTAFDRYLGRDAIVFRPLPVPARDWLATHEPASGRLEWSPVTALNACDSSLAVTFGTWRYTARDSATADTGQYLTAWRHGEDGSWRIVLDQSLNLAELPAPAKTAGTGCGESKPVLDDLRAAERKLNGGMRNLHLNAQPVIAVRAVTLGTVTGSAQADIALTHGELVDRKVARGAEPQVRAVYVRVWQREGRAWRLRHDFTSSVTP